MDKKWEKCNKKNYEKKKRKCVDYCLLRLKNKINASAQNTSISSKPGVPLVPSDPSLLLSVSPSYALVMYQDQLVLFQILSIQHQDNFEHL